MFSLEGWGVSWIMEVLCGGCTVTLCRIRSLAPIQILKLEILTNLARADNISVLLREFQSYISGGDKGSAAATIQVVIRTTCRYCWQWWGSSGPTYWQNCDFFFNCANIYSNTFVPGHSSPHLPLFSKERQVRLQIFFVFLTTQQNWGIGEWKGVYENVGVILWIICRGANPQIHIPQIQKGLDPDPAYGTYML